MQSHALEGQNAEQAITPFQKRATVSGDIQFGAVLVMAMAFGWIESWQLHWPVWAFYVLELLLAFSTRFAVGIAFEKPSQYLGSWRSLYWRVLCFESLAWS